MVLQMVIQGMTNLIFNIIICNKFGHYQFECCKRIVDEENNVNYVESNNKELGAPILLIFNNMKSLKVPFGI